MPEGTNLLGGAGVAPEGQGRLVGRRYRLLSPVGRGGMGMVWHAHDVLLDRDVAVKELILPYGLDHAGKQVAHRRMLREARSAARLSHPGIVTVHDVVEEDGRPWIVMELVRAWSLEQAVLQSGPLPVMQAAEIGVRVLDALRHAHAAGILHRDVKPGNVLLTADRVVLTDFGIAAIEGDVTITQTGLLMGSPAYIPPERLQGRPITHAADLWSFGATLYAAVEGRPPYEGPDAVAVLGAVLTQEPNRPHRAGALLPVIEGLLRKNPADRMPAAQAAELLERVLRNHGSGLPVRDGERHLSAPLPTRDEAAPAVTPDPLARGASRVIETPSGPVRVPAEAAAGYDALNGGTGARQGAHGAAGARNGASRDPYDALRDAAGPYEVPGNGSRPGALGGASGARPDPYDALRSPSGSQDPYVAPRSSSGPQPDPYDALRSPSGPQRDRHDAFGGPSGSQPNSYDAFGSPSGSQPNSYDAFGSPSGSRPDPYDALRSLSDPPANSHDALRSEPGPQDRREALRKPAESRPGAVFDPPAGTGSPRDALVAGTTGSRAWPATASPDLADRLAKDIASENLFTRPPRPAPGTRRADDPGIRTRAAREDRDDAREGRSPVLLLLAGVGIVGVIAALLFVLWPSATPPPEEAAPLPTTADPFGTAAPDAGATAPSEEVPASTEIPAGFKARTAAGVTVAVPQDWTVSASEQAVTYAGARNSGRRVQVRKVPATGDDGLAALTKTKDETTLTDYGQIRLESSPFGDGPWKASVWEYTYTALNNVTTHAITRHVSVDRDTAYQVTFTAPDAEWDEPDTRQIMAVLWSSFKAGS
ncbi:hypothetical protein Skr01_26550 [Sphaerisporangium krabiense]|uniref:non-specific serine/threonine protein kinase n=1 Tax=Sphaerisporangium krabiense TaxID=763782 RepID=A0A7W8ZAH7_9ACTN|nr:serine/threonine-protein kinase [Sphaerisporangium krabiense]MBB5630477.1 tRNA A-37 threonylcarbamoyl transferase component Bud32 [Sphaerisporangium krabiense]GII62570.1 hypothetical protein Skr01_26550 [Sphaerisporangium krabiense]